MGARVEFSYKWVGDVMRSKGVRDALDKKADKVRDRADQLAQAEGVDLELEQSSGTRPKGRPYSRVEAPDGAKQEWGTSRTDRKRIMGRAAESS